MIMHAKLVAASTRLPQPTWAVALVTLWVSLVWVAVVMSNTTGQSVSLCWFREFFGVPCLTCGGTRCTLDLLQGHLLSALELNPLVAVGDVLIAVWLVIRVLFRRAIGVELTSGQRSIVTFVVGLAAVANWVYLVWSHSTC